MLQRSSPGGGSRLPLSFLLLFLFFHRRLFFLLHHSLQEGQEARKSTLAHPSQRAAAPAERSDGGALQSFKPCLARWVHGLLWPIRCPSRLLCLQFRFGEDPFSHLRLPQDTRATFNDQYLDWSKIAVPLHSFERQRRSAFLSPRPRPVGAFFEIHVVELQSKNSHRICLNFSHGELSYFSTGIFLARGKEQSHTGILGFNKR